MTFSISLAVLVGLAFSAVLFIIATVICWRQGLFDGGGGYAGGLDAVFIIFMYVIFWILPSILTWAIYATWFA